MTGTLRVGDTVHLAKAHVRCSACERPSRDLTYIGPVEHGLPGWRCADCLVDDDAVMALNEAHHSRRGVSAETATVFGFPLAHFGARLASLLLTGCVVTWR